MPVYGYISMIFTGHGVGEYGLEKGMYPFRKKHILIIHVILIRSS